MERILLNMALEKYKRFFRKSYQKSLHNHFFYRVINEQHVNHEGSFLMPESKLEIYCYDGLCYGLRHDLLQHRSYHRRDEGCCLTGRLPPAKWWSCVRLQSSWRCSSLKRLSFTWLSGWLHLKRQSCWSSWSGAQSPSALCVPNDELDRNRALQELPSSWLHRDLAADCRHQLSNGDWLANLPLRSCGKILV